MVVLVQYFLALCSSTILFVIWTYGRTNERTTEKAAGDFVHQMNTFSRNFIRQHHRHQLSFYCEDIVRKFSPHISQSHCSYQSTMRFIPKFRVPNIRSMLPTSSRQGYTTFGTRTVHNNFHSAGLLNHLCRDSQPSSEFVSNTFRSCQYRELSSSTRSRKFRK